MRPFTTDMASVYLVGGDMTAADATVRFTGLSAAISVVHGSSRNVRINIVVDAIFAEPHIFPRFIEALLDGERLLIESDLCSLEIADTTVMLPPDDTTQWHTNSDINKSVGNHVMITGTLADASFKTNSQSAEPADATTPRE